MEVERSQTTTIAIGSRLVECPAAEETQLSELRDELRWNREYALWKKSCAYLYDNVLVHALEWPSLTVQWLPGAHSGGRGACSDQDWTLHALLLSTHSSGCDTDRLFVVEARLPTDDDEQQAGRFEAEEGGVDLAHGWGGTAARVTVVAAATMEAEVHRARYMPQHPNIVAVKSPAHNVQIFNMAARHRQVAPLERAKVEEAEDDVEMEDAAAARSKADREEAARNARFETTFAPEHVCGGHSDEGWAVAWSPHAATAGRLLSGSDDRLVCEYDLGAGGGQPRKQVSPVVTYRGHEGGINDVAWSAVAPHLFASASDDGSLALWDNRCSAAQARSWVARVTGAHGGAPVQCVAMSPFSETLLVSGGADGTVRLWDSRCLTGSGGKREHGSGAKGGWRLRSSSSSSAAADAARPSHVLAVHGDEVLSVTWNPERETVLASAGCDRRVILWDVARVGREQSEEEARDGPPELLFVHGGHTNKVTDLSWCPMQGSTSYMASVAEDNILQIWQPTENVMTGQCEGYDDMA